MNNKKRILVIDDNEDILEAIQDLLESEGYEVIINSKGDDTIEVTKTALPDLIILDLLLSGKDGGHICRDIKKDKKLEKIPVIMMSAHPNAKSLALDTGADDFIPKPFDSKSLFLIIDKHLSRR